MNFYQRFIYFLVGILLGIILCNRMNLYSCYLPNYRVLCNIIRKQLLFDNNCDTCSIYNIEYIKKLLINGKVDFNKSKIRRKPFPIYYILYKENKSGKTFIIKIENQNKIALIKSIIQF